MAKSNSIAKRYLNEVSANMSCGKTTKKYIVKELSQTVEGYITEHPNCEMQDLYSEFGDPFQATFDLTSKEEYKDLINRAKRKAKIFAIVSTVLVALVIIAIVLVIVLLNKYGGEFEISNIRQD